MKKLLLVVFIPLMLPLSHCDHKMSATRFGLFAQESSTGHSESAKIAGTWKMSMETPHGMVSGPLQVKQDGSKLTGTYEVEHIGSMSLTGTVDGKKVSFSMAIPGADMTLTLTGTVEGDKMSGGSDHAGPWNATRQQ